LFRASKNDKSLYVLTSEHVLLPGTKSTNQVCHTISYQKSSPQGRTTWSEAPAELVATDWQAGLAILKVTGNETASASEITASEIPTYKDLIATLPVGQSFEVTGLPYGTQAELRSDSGVFAATQSLRHLMPNGSPVFELQDADGEFLG
jgi:S1-C subfamily serine protease